MADSTTRDPPPQDPAAASTRDEPRAGETCTCGRPATVVFLTGDHGRVPYCDRPDGGRQSREDRP